MKHHLLLSCCIPAALFAAPALAAEPAADEGGIGEIVVTAQKREQNLQSVPVSVTALTNGTLENRNVVAAVDLQRTTPGLTFGNTVASQFTFLVSIRGLQTSDAQAMLDPSVGIYVDGVYMPTTRGFGAEQLVDVERVEVLKGPQGTLYGRNTTGGAISILSKKPTDEFEGELKGAFGNFNTFRYSGFVNVPVAHGLAVRLAGQYFTTDGWTRNAFLNRKVTNADGYNLRGTVKADLADNVELIIRGDWSKGHGGGQAQMPMALNACNVRATGAPATGGLCPTVSATDTLVSYTGTNSFTGAAIQYAIYRGLATPVTFAGASLAAPGGLANAVNAVNSARAAWMTQTGYTLSPVNLPVYHNTPGSEDYKNGGGSMELSFDAGPGTLKSITAYRYFQLANRQDVDATPFLLLDVTKLPSSLHQITQELQYTGNAFTDRLEYVLGGYFYHYSGRDDVNNTATPSVNPNNPARQRAWVGKRSFALYGQGTFEIMPDTHLTGGLRWTAERRKLTSGNNAIATATGIPFCTLPPQLVVSSIQCELNLQKDEKNVSWKVGIDHRFSSELFLYANVSRGYKSGGMNQSGNTDPNSYNFFDPEVVTQYEIGFKADLLDRKLRLNGAAYQSDVKGLQRQIVTTIGGTGNPVTRYQNAANSTIKGFELEAVVQPVSGLSLSATVGYVDAKYKDYKVNLGSGASAIVIDRSDQPFRMIPKWSYNLAADYSQPTSFGSINASVNWSWKGDMYMDPQSRPYSATLQEAYGLLGARLTASIDSLDADVSVWGNNLANKKYWMTQVYIESFGFQTGAVGTPRSYGVTLTKRF